jgi:hypothetical protein
MRILLVEDEWRLRVGGVRGKLHIRHAQALQTHQVCLVALDPDRKIQITEYEYVVSS